MIPSLCQSEEILFICCPWSSEEMENKPRPRREGELGETSCRQDLSFDQLQLIATVESHSRRADHDMMTVRKLHDLQFDHHGSMRAVLPCAKRWRVFLWHMVGRDVA
jgi:hypothetical protein